jgi:hypothetical protein
MSLRDRWEAHAAEWINWARAPGHEAPFVIKGDYLQAFEYSDAIKRDGLTMTFHSHHRPLESYFSALEEARFLIEALREPKLPDRAVIFESSRRWQRVPLFLHLRSRRWTRTAHP